MINFYYLYSFKEIGIYVLIDKKQKIWSKVKYDEKILTCFVIN